MIYSVPDLIQIERESGFDHQTDSFVEQGTGDNPDHIHLIIHQVDYIRSDRTQTDYHGKMMNKEKLQASRLRDALIEPVMIARKYYRFGEKSTLSVMAGF